MFAFLIDGTIVRYLKSSCVGLHASLMVISTLTLGCSLADHELVTGRTAEEEPLTAVAATTATPQVIAGAPAPAAAAQPTVDASSSAVAVSATSFTDQRADDVPAPTSLDIVTPRAQANIAYAFDLAERGAVQSARAEFIMGLNLIARAHDADEMNESRAHTQAVSAGLTAIEEARDFAPVQTRHGHEVNLAQLATVHRTPVLREIDIAQCTPDEALQRYHAYATQQLAFAGGDSEVASMALYGLGRAESITVAGSGNQNSLGGPSAISLYQAALLVNPRNHMAANELGVMMARYGHLPAAREALLHSLSIAPQAETWHNLATVYRKMGQADLAQHAQAEHEGLLTAARSGEVQTANSVAAGSRPVIQWVDATAFSGASTPYGLDGPAISSTSVAEAESTPQQDSVGKRIIARLAPWMVTSQSTETQPTTRSSSQSDPPQDNRELSRRLLK